ncbi:MAG: hypothetical protein JWO94_3879, partial [Verrucomicrobiaceae bacterium]|nr:hypothetical protein [Verrucomicrobiaceae bacterium]
MISFTGLLQAADPKPEVMAEIPDGAKRAVVVTVDNAHTHFPAPQADLPPDMELVTVAAAPLVSHPMMGCLDTKGRLFVTDATGVNWTKAQLEAN